MNDQAPHRNQQARNKNGKGDSNFKRHNQRKTKVPTTPHVELEDIRKDTRDYSAIRRTKMFFRIKVPYDPEIVKLMHQCNGVFTDKKYWRVHISHHYTLKPYFDHIQALADEAYRDELVSTARETEGDFKVWIDEQDIADYEVGFIVFRNGKEWVVTHISRPYYAKEGKVRHAIYLKRYEEPPLDLKAENSFKE